MTTPTYRFALEAKLQSVSPLINHEWVTIHEADTLEDVQAYRRAMHDNPNIEDMRIVDREEQHEQAPAWIPTHRDQNLPKPDQWPNEVMAVIYLPDPVNSPVYQYHIAHLVTNGDDLYWRIHDHPPGFLTPLFYVTHWHLLPPDPEMPSKHAKPRP